MSRHHARGGAHRPRRLRRRGVALLFVVALTAVIVLLGDARTCPRSETLEAFAIVATPQNNADTESGVDMRVRAGELPDLTTAVARRLDEGSFPAAASRTDNVHAGESLHVRAHVTDSGGRPAGGVKVVFAWAEGARVSYDTAVSDDSGSARATHWVGAREKGRRTVLVVSASRGVDSATAYTWFVAE